MSAARNREDTPPVLIPFLHLEEMRVEIQNHPFHVLACLHKPVRIEVIGNLHCQ